MNNPLHAPFYADQALQVETDVEANWQIARDTFRLRLPAPEIARHIVPGQFVMLRLAGCDDPLIGRALALYEVIRDGHGRPRAIDVVYIVKGKLTTRLAQLPPGHPVSLWGPLGNGFRTDPCDHLVLAAGGIGQTPFLALAREALGHTEYGDAGRASGYAREVSLVYGVRSAELIAGEDDFRNAGTELYVCTDDGSRLPKARVPEVLEQVLGALPSAARTRIACCGPEAMMQRVAEVAAAHAVPCQVSLETPMACGIGICFSCVARVRQSDGGWDYKRTCVEGPVFEADQLIWSPS